MNFTREPIIETIISPKEGCKLLVRSSRGSDGAEEYYVDAIEVVSFGRAFFFRSMERPKAFLVPVSDYEILEVKEPRVALKTSSHDRQIKIGGGRDHAARQQPKEVVSIDSDEEELSSESEQEAPLAAESEEGGAPRLDNKRRDRRRRRHRRGSDEQEWNTRRSGSQEGAPADAAARAEGSTSEEEVKSAPLVMPSLIPPPTTLISQTLSRYKGKEFVEETALPVVVAEHLPVEVHEESAALPEQS